MTRFSLADLERAHCDIAALWDLYSAVAMHLHDSLDDDDVDPAAWEQRTSALVAAEARALEIWDRYQNVLWLDFDRAEPLSVIDRWELAIEEWSGC